MHGKVDTPLGFMSQPTNVRKTVIPFVQEDRKLNFSSNNSPAKDVDKHEFLVYCSGLLLLLE